VGWGGVGWGGVGWGGVGWGGVGWGGVGWGGVGGVGWGGVGWGGGLQFVLKPAMRFPPAHTAAAGVTATASQGVEASVRAWHLLHHIVATRQGSALLRTTRNRYESTKLSGNGQHDTKSFRPVVHTACCCCCFRPIVSRMVLQCSSLVPRGPCCTTAVAEAGVHKPCPCQQSGQGSQGLGVFASASSRMVLWPAGLVKYGFREREPQQCSLGL
jgi:hypothetical protein